MKKLSLLFVAFICGAGGVMAQNLITNGNFEQYESRSIVNREGYSQEMQMPTGWNIVKLVDDESGYDAGVTKWGDFILERNSEWGTWEFKGRQTEYSRLFYQEINAPMGGTVTFSVDVKGGAFVGDEDPIIKFECRAGDPLPESSDYILLSEAIPHSKIGSDWATVSASVTLPAAYTYYVGFSITNVSSDLWVQIRNISFTYGSASINQKEDIAPIAIVDGNTVRVSDCDQIAIYNSLGVLMQSSKGNEDFVSEPLPKGIYIVCMNGVSQKIAINGF